MTNVKTLSEINQYTSQSVNPMDYPDKYYELYSVPSYDNDYPEIIQGKEIGSTKVTVEENDVLICKINPRINRVWVVKHRTDYQLLASSEWIIVRNPEVNPNYLKHYFSSPSFRMLINSQVAGIGGSLIRAQPKQVAKYPVPLPSRKEQDEITIILDETDKLISLRKKQLQKLDDLVKSRFVEMFGDPVSNPKEWETVPLSNEADIKIGPFGSLLHKEDYIVGGHALVNPSHIVSGKIVPDHELTVSDEKYAELAVYHLKVGDVVLGRRGEMGRCAVVEQEGLLCGTGSLIIRSKGDLRADFIQKIISFPSFKETIEEMAVGQTMPNLNVPIVSAFQIIKPPKKAQDQYYDFVDKMMRTKTITQQGLNKLEQMKQALMQKYFG